MIERLQGFLPFNPQKFGAVNPAHLAFNTAASFTTNTNWQAYSRRNHDELFHPDGRPGVSQLRVGGGRHFAGNCVHSRHCAASEGDHRQLLGRLGPRLVCGCCLPFCIVGALLLVSQGVVQNLRPYDKANLVEPQQVQTTGADGKTGDSTTVTEQTIAQGPVASQEIIKEWGTNGGGFFNANSAHPFENPTPLIEPVEMVSIFAMSAGLTYTLGRMTGSQRHGWAVWAAMAILFLAGVTVPIGRKPTEIRCSHGVDQHATAMQSGGNMEGKEVRFGIANSALFATVTTDASCGAINGWHDSFTPLGGMVPLVNIMLSEVIFGGVGAGMYGMLIYIVLAVFIAGLMVGRTPEYLGKKIEAYDVKMAMLVALVFPLVILAFAAISSREWIRHIQHIESRATRLQRDSLRLHFGGWKQRLGVRRADREHALVQHRQAA